MIRSISYVAAGAAVLTLYAPMADARTRHVVPRAHHRHAGNRAPGYGHSAQTRPQGGYGNGPAESSYQGPGSDVFRRTIQTEQAPGVTRELDFDAKQSATGGPAGGLPSNGNGP